MSVQILEAELRESLSLRVQDVPVPPDVQKPIQEPQITKVAVLFSGGLDCSVLARITHDILPLEESIDLLNVAFENPRVILAAERQSMKLSKPTNDKSPEA